MGATTTLITSRDVAEHVLTDAFGREYDAAWFPATHHWTVDTEDAVVYIYHEPAYLGRLSAADRHQLTERLGAAPRSAFHVIACEWYAGSPAVAARVAGWLDRQCGGASVIVGPDDDVTDVLAPAPVPATAGTPAVAGGVGR